MKHNVEIKKLEKLLIEKKYESKELQKEISKITESIEKLKRENEHLNGLSIKAHNVLGGYSFEEAKAIIIFYIEMITTVETDISKIYKNFDFKLLDDDNFIHTCIVSIGGDFFSKLRKDEVKISECRSKMSAKRGVNRHNVGKRLMSKLSKGAVVSYLKRYGEND